MAGAPLGNQNARKAHKFREHIKGILAEMDEAHGRDGATLDAIVAGYVREAMTDPNVRRDFLDRMFGKPAQAVSLDGDGEGGAIALKAMIELIKPSA